MIDWTINIGTILQAVVILGAGMGFLSRTQNHIERLSVMVEVLQDEIKKLGGVLSTLANQDARLNGIDRRVDDLQRGRGFIVEDMPDRVRRP